MSEIFNKNSLIHYENLLGKSEILSLWAIFIEESQKNISQIKSALDSLDYSSLRSVYHKFKPAAEVFGLDSFALLCAKIEKDIVSHNLAHIERDILQSFSLWEDSVSVASVYMDSAYGSK